MKSGAPFFRIDIIYIIYLDVKYFSVVCVSIYFVKTTLTTVEYFFAKKLNVCPSDIIWNSTALNASIFFPSGFSFTDTDDSQDSKGREGTIFYSTLPLPPAHQHSDIYLQLCMWDDYHIFLIAPLVFTRLLLDEIYQLIELPFDWLMIWH